MMAFLLALAVGLSVPGFRIQAKGPHLTYDADLDATQGPKKIHLRTTKIHRYDPYVGKRVPMWYTWEANNIPEYDRCGWTHRYFCRPAVGDTLKVYYCQKAGHSVVVSVEKSNDRNGGQ